MKLKFSVKKLTGYILLPLAFFIIMNLFLYCTLKPFVDITLNVWSMFSSETRSDDNEIYNDIFTEDALLGYDGTINASNITYPTYGTRYGEIKIGTNNTVYTIPLILGDNNSILNRGAGHYLGSHFPGEGSTILVSGHNTTHFYCLKYAKIGEIIEVNTHYGKYKYEIVDVAPKHKSDPTAYDLYSDKEYLVLYTCYPFDAYGLLVQRYFVTAKFVSGPKIDIYS